MINYTNFKAINLMKKIIIAISFGFLFFLNAAYAESYYFKNCKLTDVLIANYIIDTKNRTITVNFEAADGSFQEFDDGIETIQKDKIISKKIKSGKSDDSFFIYYLDSNSNSVVKQNYKKEIGLGIFRPVGPKQQSYCEEVKSDWDVEKIEVAETNKEQEEILKIQKKILIKQKTNIKCKSDNYKTWTGCVGTYTNEKDFIYIGKFENGKIIDGTILYPGGSKYSGTFQNDKRHGQGTFIYSDGTKYYGEWKEGKITGSGTKTWRDGRKYSGTFKNDKPDGDGTFFYVDGSKYAGEWKDGKRHGKGTLTYSDGQTYVGRFAAGLPYGDGLCIDQSGSSNACTLLETKENKSKIKNRHSIKLKAKKWVKISEYENTSGKAKKFIDKLKNDFDTKASELCSSIGNFNILEKRIEILEMDETPAIGTETVVKMGIDGVVQCEKK